MYCNAGLKDISQTEPVRFTQLMESCAKGVITWRISARAEIPSRSSGSNFVAITWRVSARAQAQFFHCCHFVSLNIPSMRLLKLKFQPGLKFRCDYMRFFSLPARDEHFQPGLKMLARFLRIYSPGRNLLHVIATFISREFYSQPGLKSQPG